ncbi:rhomboid family intramembrane serine protease [Motilibacter aurantiacus]|uniref:rhomboid family intramembrane serine protease n=1 Tax=Motilibacter aurantiacus TaxID=2714955 RepID=UPI001407ED03|nr:rhomboid family intramembrane serine protease [Motilibacter aurantiacus]NHC46441.1 rhomboid family intramembrane serine protease [Motilibacter aurantiacus]
MTTAEPPAAPGGPAPSAVPTCYRHPDREAHVRCTRCNRPICPDCMIPAAVGFQCPDEVKAAARSTRSARTIFGGRVADDPGYVTKILVGICVVVFLLGEVAPDLLLEERFAMVVGYDGVSYYKGVATGEWYRLVTAAFLHGSVLHLLFNMYALWLFGPNLEAAFGRARYAALYLVSAVGGCAVSYAFSPLGTASVGASGAVFGLFAAQLVVSRRLRMDASGLYALIAVNFAIGFIVSGVDWRAHAGGLATGAVVAAALAYAPRANRTLVQAGGLVLVLVAALALTTWRSADLLDASVGEVVGCEAAHPAGGQAYFECATG